MQSLPQELVVQTILYSLDPPPPAPLPSISSSAHSSATTTPSSSGSPNSVKHDPFAAAFASHVARSRSAVLRSYALTSRSFRSLAQPILYKDPVLPTTASLHAFLAVIENGEYGAYLGSQVRTLTLGTKRDGNTPGADEPCVGVQVALRRLASRCDRVREVTIHGQKRVDLADFEGMSHLRALTFQRCTFATSTVSQVALPNLTHLTLIKCNHATFPRSPALVPALRALRLVQPHDAGALSSGQPGDFFTGVAPQLRCFSLDDQAAEARSAGAASTDVHPLDDTLQHLSTSLVHVDVVNALPTHVLPRLPLPTLLSIRTLSFSLSGAPAAGARRTSLRWAPLADSHLRDTLAILRIVLLPPDALFSASELLDGCAEALPAWARALQGSEVLERVLLPPRAFEDGLGEMVVVLEAELRRAGRGVALLALDEDEMYGAKESTEGAGFWSEVARLEEEEKEERRGEERW
ncbi:hypothetical protein JCM3770_001033 [Rhodotorula araucariae]